MKILPLYGYPNNYKTNKPVITQNPPQKRYATNEIKFFAYQDYNINFTGRTPEDFYAQDFNRNNMPRTMFDYLYQDYSERQHIPPEQMMKEVFKYLEIADNFADVKEIYPNEDLFSNLHPNNVKSKTGVLYEIKVAKELSDTPLLKDGSDNFGMYLLKKIYIEGKTLRQINKDFLEKDINDEYKGIISTPADYDTLKAYGIKYPKSGFWHSFIATKEEYRKFFIENMPEYQLNGTKNTQNKIKNTDKETTQVEEPVRPRKHTLKPHRIKEIESDITDSKGDIEQIEKTVVKRFRKDDPEAKFIVKYMSPIMTIAAERAHLSEEMKIFNETEKEKGQTVKGKTMFERFWKANPQTLYLFSNAITATIDMFEDIYNCGGSIPINKDFEQIKPGNPDNENIIDFVSPEFFELLHYTKTIEPERNKKYFEHDEMQKQWEEHFKNKPEVLADDQEIQPIDEIQKPETDQTNIEDLSPEEQAKIIAAQNPGSTIYTLKYNDGSESFFITDIDKSLNIAYDIEGQIFPNKVARLYKKCMLEEMEISDEYKFCKALIARLSKEDIEEYEKIVEPKIIPHDKFTDMSIEYAYKFCELYPQETTAAAAAMADALVKSGMEVDTDIFLYDIFDYYIKLNKDERADMEKVFKNMKSYINEQYNKYMQPMTYSERNKVSLQIMDMIKNYDFKQNEFYQGNDLMIFISMLNETAKNPQTAREMRDVFRNIINDYPPAKSLQNDALTKEQLQGRFDNLMFLILRDEIFEIEKSPLIKLIDPEILRSKIFALSPAVHNRLIEAHNFDN